MKPLIRFLATGAYTGHAPVAPGTFGTMPAVLLAPLFASVLLLGPIPYIAALAALIALAIWSADRYATETGLKDPQTVVIDEIAGYLLAVAFLPATLENLLLGFIWFRLFDITKPPPARQAEGLHGGLGIVADDLVAGVYANLAVRLTIFGLTFIR